MKKIFIAILLSLVAFSSCKKETCPEPFCTYTMTFTVGELAGRADLPVDKLTMILLDEKRAQRTGPIYIDLSGAAENAVKNNGVYTFTISQPLPYGDFKMWIWGNVTDESVATFDWTGLNMKSNNTGNDYLLAVAEDVSIHQRHLSATKELHRLTARVNMAAVGAPDEVIDGVTLFVNQINTRVDNNLEYTTHNSASIDFDATKSDIPPSHIYIFPTLADQQTQFTLGYNLAGGGGRGSIEKSQIIDSGQVYDIEFNTMPD